jgi:esterase/lipase
MNPYYYYPDDRRANLTLKKTTQHWVHCLVDIPDVHSTRYPEYNTMRGEYYQPQGVTDAPLVILIHGMGDQSVIPCQFLARHLVKKGMACFILYLVFHSSRLPGAIKSRLPLLTAEEWFEGYQLSVIDIRQVIDWASRRTEINKEQIATFGISLGGFVSAIAMGIDKRIKAGVFVVTGGNSEKMNWLSKANAYRYQRAEVEYRQIQHRYTEYLAAVAEKGFENVTPARQSFLTDPMTFAPYLRQRPVLMLNARWDKYIPREAVQDFWQACGQPPIKWFPSGHASIWLWYPVISHKIADFLTSTFGMTI